MRELRIAMELTSNEAVRAAVEAGLGATATSALGGRVESRGWLASAGHICGDR
jgi:microcystin degradation protein MlrC